MSLLYTPAIELGPCDIGAYRSGDTGIAYVTSFDSGRAGPHVAINALTHGNEVCGAHALCFLFESGVRPVNGRLTLCFANVAAYQRFDADAPFDSRFVDEDFNRVWDADVLDGPRDSSELARAREMRPLVDTVDYLLDLHSTALPNAPMLLCGMQDKGLALARAVGYPARVVIDAGHAAGRRLRDYGPFDDPESPKAAMLVECGQHFDMAAKDAAIETTLRFLRHCGIVDPAFVAAHLRAEPAPQVVTRVTEAVTIESEDFVFARDFAGFEVIPEAGTLIARDGRADVRTPYDDCVLVMPARDLKQGLTAVRLGRIVK
ncbi:MAG: succinylglutamate desuccinylase/aspartoacylase family protein [Proteobacteria bacterium]|nr:succinylglutamate desuccinylase/aspartoacylase family protein [Pseudomonadota bacterium]